MDPTRAALAIEHPWFDSHGAPLYVWTFPREFADEELRAALDAHARWRQVAHFDSAFVVDLSPIVRTTARQRWMVARHISDATDHSTRWVRATSLIVPTSLHRALATAVFWIHRPPTPILVTEHFAEGLAHAMACLADDLPRVDRGAPPP